MPKLEPNGELDEPPATERQRTALIHWGVDRGRAEDPGLSRWEASRWLGALISAKRQPRPASGPSEVRASSPPSNGSASPPSPPPTPSIPSPPPSTSSEPEAMEMELTVPTKIPYSTLRLRTRASRKPGEPLIELADRLTDALLEVAQREVGRIEQVLRPGSPRPPGPGNSPAIDTSPRGTG